VKAESTKQTLRVLGLVNLFSNFAFLFYFLG